MTYFLILWIGFSCPGGILAGLIPESAKPLLCQRQIQYEIYDPARLELAKNRIKEIGPASKLLVCRGLQCKEIKVTWTTTAHFSQ